MYKVDGYGCIVTGGASGLGLGFTEILAENGARVTMLDVNAERIDDETKRLQGAELKVCGRVVDVCDHIALDNAFDEVAETYGRLDVVFANAGIDPGLGPIDGGAGSERPRVPEGALENYTDERWNRVIEVNLNGVFATMRAAARHMKPQQSGHIIVTTSLGSTKAETVIGSAYMAAKAGAAHLTRCVALELAAYNISVNAIKGLALFLASPASAYITGQEIVIDGGWGLGTAD
jgi:NAD(P)-dependent dehydrogenase (short-subunit alcohol dehydrogenase family)